MKAIGHSFNGRICNWVYCCRCGLIALSNDKTRKAINRRCPGDEDEQKKEQKS